MINEYNAFSCSGFDQSALHGAVHRSLSVYKRVFLVLRCQNFHDLKPLCYSYDRVTSLISNFLELNTKPLGVEKSSDYFTYDKML